MSHAVIALHETAPTLYLHDLDTGQLITAREPAKRGPLYAKNLERAVLILIALAYSYGAETHEVI